MHLHPQLECTLIIAFYVNILHFIHAGIFTYTQWQVYIYTHHIIYQYVNVKVLLTLCSSFESAE